MIIYQNIIKAITSGDHKNMPKMTTKLPLIALITVLLMGLFVTTAQASGTAIRTETICDTTSYGIQNCHNVVVEIPVHDAKTTNTALPNLNLVIAALSAILVLSSVTYIYTK